MKTKHAGKAHKKDTTVKGMKVSKKKFKKC